MVLNSFLSDAQMSEYIRLIAQGQRRGQAFFNVLDEADQARLRGSLYDPFYFDTPGRLFEAIDYLTS